MAENYKILGQESALSLAGGTINQANVVYTVPENTQASISSISVINNGTAANYSLGIVKAEDVSTSYATEDYVNYIVYGGGGIVYYSFNGTVWYQASGTPPNLPTSSAVRGVYGGGRFVLARWVYNDFVYVVHSSDGISWSEFSVLSAGTSAETPYIAYGNGTYVIALRGANDRFLYSTDFQNWSSYTLPTANYVNDIAYGNGVFVCVQTSTTALVSSDGITWTSVSMPIGVSSWTSVEFGNGYFVALSNGDLAARSTDGINWSTSSLPASTNWPYLSYGGDGIFIGASNVSSYDDTLAVSTDTGLTWQVVAPPGGPGVFDTIAVGADGLYGTYLYYAGPPETEFDFANEIFYSEDGINWTLAANLPTRDIHIEMLANNLQPVNYNTLSNIQTIVPTTTLDQNVVDEIAGGITLSAGDQIRIYSESGDIVVHVYGVEMS